MTKTAATARKTRAFTAKEYADFADGLSIRARKSIMVPVSVAAAALGYEQTTIRAHIRQGKLREVAIDCDGLIVKGVAIGSIQDVLKTREEAVASLAEELHPYLWHRGAQTIEYGELMSMVGMSSNNPHHRDMIGRALGHMSAESQLSHKFMISALVVLKATGRPNDSFFHYAEIIGAKPGKKSNERFWREDIARIKAWAGPQEWDEDEEN